MDLPQPNELDEAKEEDETGERLKELYYNPEDPGSYGGVDRLFRSAKKAGVKGVTRGRVKKFLADQQSYTLHKPARRRFKRNPTYVKGIDGQWQADLADMQALSSENKGTNYIMTVIDIFSKRAWAIPIKNKSGKEMLTAFQQLFKEAHPRKPARLQTDAGKEFLNKEVQGFLKREGVHHFTSNSDQKAAVVERFNRTLKSRIWTYFTAHQTRQYLDILPKILEAYNNTYHRSIGRAPNQVTKKDENEIWVRLYGDGDKEARPKISEAKKGQMVRVSKVKGAFEKGYIPNWSEEHFLVQSEKSTPRRVFKLVDKGGEEVKGSWYPEEVQEIAKNRYLIEKVIRKRKSKKGVKELLVKWKGWPAKFNTWVPESDLERIQ